MVQDNNKYGDFSDDNPRRISSGQSSGSNRASTEINQGQSGSGRTLGSTNDNNANKGATGSTGSMGSGKTDYGQSNKGSGKSGIVESTDRGSDSTDSTSGKNTEVEE